MDARQAFKFAFISRCIDSGLTTPEEMLDAAKTATEKVASGLGPFAAIEGITGAAGKLWDAGGKVLEYGLPALALAPPIVGAGAGALASHLTDASDYDVDEAKNQEVIDEYHRQADRMRHEGMLRQYVTPSRNGFRRSALL